MLIDRLQVFLAADGITARDVRLHVQAILGNHLNNRLHAKGSYDAVMQAIRSDGFKISRRIKDLIWAELERVEAEAQQKATQVKQDYSGAKFILVRVQRADRLSNDQLREIREQIRQFGRLLDYNWQKLEFFLKVPSSQQAALKQFARENNYRLKEYPNEDAYAG